MEGRGIEAAKEGILFCNQMEKAGHEGAEGPGHRLAGKGKEALRWEKRAAKRRGLSLMI